MIARQIKTKVKLTRKEEAKIVQNLFHDLVQYQDRDHDHAHDLVLLILHSLLNENNLNLQQHIHKESNRKKKVNFHQMKNKSLDSECVY
jgi:hypothetical protein